MRLITLFATLAWLVGCGAPASPYEGIWGMQWEGRNFMVLTLKAADQGFEGTLSGPEHFEYSSDGTFSKINGAIIQRPVAGTLREDVLELVVHEPDGDLVLAMKQVDADLAEARFAEGPKWMAPWHFTRVMGEKPVVAKDWTVTYPPEIVAVQETLQKMSDEDQAIRLTSKISNRAMDAMTAKHRPELVRIHQKYGWPKWSQFGREAGHNFWLLVQHQGAELQRAWLPEMERAQTQGEASPQDYALLFDRVQVGLGKPQRWGSQTKCVEGKAVLAPVEDPGWLAGRRKMMHMQPVDEYVASLQASCANRVP